MSISGEKNSPPWSTEIAFAFVLDLARLFFCKFRTLIHFWIESNTNLKFHWAFLDRNKIDWYCSGKWYKHAIFCSNIVFLTIYLICTYKFTNFAKKYKFPSQVQTKSIPVLNSPKIQFVSGVQNNSLCCQNLLLIHRLMQFHHRVALCYRNGVTLPKKNMKNFLLPMYQCSVLWPTISNYKLSSQVSNQSFTTSTGQIFRHLTVFVIIL